MDSEWDVFYACLGYLLHVNSFLYLPPGSMVTNCMDSVFNTNRLLGTDRVFI